jgi:hypothetical protein
MNCPECQDLLQRRLDGDLPPARTALDGHLAECAECRARHIAAQRLADGLRLLPRPVPPAGLAQRIVSRALEQRRTDRAWRRRTWTAAAVAAGLLLLVLAGYQLNRSGVFDDPGGRGSASREGATPRAKKTARARHDHAPGGKGGPFLNETIQEAGTAALALTRRTAGETVAQARRLLPGSTLTLPPLKPETPLTPALDPSAESLRQAGQGMTAGLRPVAASARRAFGLFLREIAPMNPEPQSGS